MPFECKYCLKKFCLDHRAPADHNCTKNNDGIKSAITCPLCLKTVKFEKYGLSNDEILSIHEATECDQSNYEKKAQEKKKKCAVPKCSSKLT